MKEVDFGSWPRREHYELFHRADYSHFNICANVDVSLFHEFVKREGLSFYYSMVWISSTVANQIAEFRYRIRDGKVVLHECVHPSFTDLTNSDNDLFKMVTVDLEDNMCDFMAKCRVQSENQTRYFPFDEIAGRDDLLYITCIPWVSFTMLTHTMQLNRDDSIPRISWGKYFQQDRRLLMPFSVQVNHALADGIHVGRYFEQLQQMLSTPGSLIE